MMNAFLTGLEGRTHAENDFAVLDGVYPPGGKRAAVAGALNDENRALLGIPGRRKYPCSECT